MSYKVFLRGGEEKIVSDKQGEEIRKLFLDTEVSRNTSVEIDGDAMELRRITGVSVIKMGGGISDVDTDAKQKESYKYLARCSKEPIDEKVRREIDGRILPGLPKGRGLAMDIETVRGVIRNFYVKNPNYPWCPMAVWEDAVIGKGTAPYFYKFVLRNDLVVSDWLELGSPYA